MARTYIPTLKATVIKLSRYLTRYDFTITENLDAGDVSLYHNFKVALFALAQGLQNQDN